MAATPEAFSLGWDQFAAGVAAVGALGLAAFGLTEALGKAIAFRSGSGRDHWGLPYAGLEAVKRAIRPLGLALSFTYGSAYLDIIAQQYRSDRSKGAAPDTIRQGVRLALPFMPPDKAADLIDSVWNMGRERSERLAKALQTDAPAPAQATATPRTPIDPDQALAGRFAAALDARINAAFDLAEERYEAYAKMLSGFVAIALALVLNYGLGTVHPARSGATAFVWEPDWLVRALHRYDLPWLVAFVIGCVAVPLAPVAKDISSKLQDALTAFKAIPARLGR